MTNDLCLCNSKMFVEFVYRRLDEVGLQEKTVKKREQVS